MALLLIQIADPIDFGPLADPNLDFVPLLIAIVDPPPSISSLLLIEIADPSRFRHLHIVQLYCAVPQAERHYVLALSHEVMTSSRDKSEYRPNIGKRPKMPQKVTKNVPYPCPPPNIPSKIGENTRFAEKGEHAMALLLLRRIV